MNFAYLFPAMPLPVLSLLLPLGAAMALMFIRVYDIWADKYEKARFKITVNQRPLKIFFFILLLLNVLITFSIWKNYQSGGSTFYILGSNGWAKTLSGDPAKKMWTLVQVDAFGAISAVVMGVIAFIAGLRSLADKKNILDQSKVTYYLLTLCGIQGIFYSNGLLALLIFICLSQIGASGLFHWADDSYDGLKEWLWYFASRMLIVLMFLAGTLILYYKYGADNITILSTMIKSGPPEKLAYALLVVPLLFLFIKASAYVTDSASRCFFAIRAQAAFFVILRIVFSLYGLQEGLEKIPLLFTGIGLVSLIAALIFMAKENDPIKIAESLELFMKGFMLAAMGISLSGTYSAQAAAEYGIGAMESMVSLWILFLPVSAALSFICCLLKREECGIELWNTGGLFRRMPFSGTALFISVAVIAGLPPFVGFSAKQYLYRSANYISPFLTLMLFTCSILLLAKALFYAASVMFGRSRGAACENQSGLDAKISLPLLILFMILTFATVAPGKTFDLLVSPSVHSLMNRGQLINMLQQEDK